MAHPHEELVREGFAAFRRGDMETLDQLFADEATWHAAGDNPLAGDFEGKQQIFSNFARVRELAETLEQEIHDVIANDEHAVALVHVTASRNGKQLEDNQVFVFHIEDEKVRSVWLHNYDGRKADEFWN